MPIEHEELCDLCEAENELAERELAHASTIAFLDQHAIDFPDYDVSGLRAAHERRIERQRQDVARLRRERDHPDAPSSSLN